MFYLTKKRMMSAIEPHMKCIEPLKKLDLNYIWIPYLVIKEDDKYYFSELKYRETTYKVYDRDEPTVEFDFEFSYNNDHIEEHNVHYMEIAYKKWMQVYKDAVFEKDDIKDMYLVFYKNRRHNGNEIYDISVYHNMKKVIELKDFSMFCDDNSNMDFQDFTYTKILKGGFEETWRVTNYINEELEDRYDPWEDAKQKRALEEAEADAYVEEIESMDYEELKREYFECVKEIRGKMNSLMGLSGEKAEPVLSNRLIDEEEIRKAFYESSSRNAARIQPPEHAGASLYELTPVEQSNDKCLVFEDGEIVNYIHLSTKSEVDWDKNDYWRAKHYSEDCRYIEVDGTIFDLYNPKDIMRVPIGDIKIDEDLLENFKDEIGYDKYDLRLERIVETETEKLRDGFWTDSQIKKMVDIIANQGKQEAMEYYKTTVGNYCDDNEILLTKENQLEIIEYYLFNANRFIIEKDDIDEFTPLWCIEYLRSIDDSISVEQHDSNLDELNLLFDFWDYDRSLDYAKMMTLEGEEAASEHFLTLATEYCKENELDMDPHSFIDFIKDTIGINEDQDNEDYEDDDDDEEDDDNNHSDYELLDFFQARAQYCFEPALLVPLAHIAINMALLDGQGSHGCERIVAQLVANDEDEYGEYLESILSKRSKYWEKDKSVAYGKQLKNWAKNTREYNWLSGNFPDLVPKTKGAYSTAKKKRTKRYIELKELAESKGYYLDDNTCDYSCW